MKKLTGRVLITVLIAAMIVSCSPRFSAAAEPRLIGDADGDGEITILDATRIQRRLAGLGKMDALGLFLADTNGDGRLDILDATRIQRKLAGLGTFYDDGCPGGYSGYYIADWRFFADYDSGMARVGTPVTFRAEALAVRSPVYGDPQEPMTYAFYINDALVQERSEKNELIHTFTEAGSYRVRVEMQNAFGDICTATLSPYRVAQPYSLDRPVIVSAVFRDDTAHSSGDSQLYLRAEGGAGGPYRYMVTAVGIYDGYEKDGFFIEEPIDEHSPTVISTGYTIGEVYQIPRGLYQLKSPIPEEPAEAVIAVYAKDADGHVSEPVTIIHRLECSAG